MKTKNSKLLKHFKRTPLKKEPSSAAVNFTDIQRVSVSKEKNLQEIFLEEFKNSIRSGDHELWRMWS